LQGPISLLICNHFNRRACRGRAWSCLLFWATTRVAPTVFFRGNRDCFRIIALCNDKGKG